MIEAYEEVGVSGIQTNRDLYLAIAALTERHRSNARDLEEYLRALWQETSRFRDAASLSADEFLELLSSAFTSSAPHFQEAWRSRYPEGEDPLADCLASKMGGGQRDSGAGAREAPNFDTWESFLLRQIVDLREMAEQGSLANEYRYFGIDSPRGQRWYNFDPCTFLECAASGSFGGWEPDDETGRDYVPGPVAVMGADGTVTTVDPQDVPNPVIPLREVSWEDFLSFLGCGQWYE